MKMVKFNIKLPSMWNRTSAGFSQGKYRSCSVNFCFESSIGKFYASRVVINGTIL